MQTNLNLENVAEGDGAWVFKTRSQLNRKIRLQASLTGNKAKGSVDAVESELTTRPGYINRNGQQVLRATDIPGTDHNQRVYLLVCTKCRTEYGANGSDIFQRKCPACQGGSAGCLTA